MLQIYRLDDPASALRVGFCDNGARQRFAHRKQIGDRHSRSRRGDAQGGLPQGRPTLLCGSAGCGKTLFGMTFLCNGAVQYGEPGVFMASRSGRRTSPRMSPRSATTREADRREEARRSTTSRSSPPRSPSRGEYDLEGFSSGSGYAIDSVGAKRVVLDTIESLFGGLEHQAVLRAEIAPPFRLAQGRRASPPSSPASAAKAQLTRYGLEEYVSDCVILLDNRVHDQLSTRRLRIVKYRGSAHGTNEYPFLIDERRHHRDADHLARPAMHGVDRAVCRAAWPISTPMFGRARLLPRLQHPGVRHGRHRQDRRWPRMFANAVCAAR